MHPRHCSAPGIFVAAWQAGDKSRQYAKLVLYRLSFRIVLLLGDRNDGCVLNFNANLAVDLPKNGNGSAGSFEWSSAAGSLSSDSKPNADSGQYSGSGLSLFESKLWLSVENGELYSHNWKTFYPNRLIKHATHRTEQHDFDLRQNVSYHPSTCRSDRTRVTRRFLRSMMADPVSTPHFVMPLESASSGLSCPCVTDRPCVIVPCLADPRRTRGDIAHHRGQPNGFCYAEEKKPGIWHPCKVGDHF